MKPQPVVTSAFFPTALAVASISLAVLLLPGGGSPVGSSGLAPALKLVAGDVVTAVKAPIVHPPAKHKSTTVVHRASRVATTPVSKEGAAVTSSSGAAVAPAHRAVHHGTVHHSPPQHKHTARQAPGTTPTVHAAAPIPIPLKHGNGKAIGHDNGKGKALGRLRKTTRSPAPVSHGEGHAYANGHGPKVHGNPGNTRHGPPVVTPGLARGKQGASHGRGGGK